jgi:hypothetical protein
VTCPTSENLYDEASVSQMWKTEENAACLANEMKWKL